MDPRLRLRTRPLFSLWTSGLEGRVLDEAKCNIVIDNATRRRKEHFMVMGSDMSVPSHSSSETWPVSNEVKSSVGTLCSRTQRSHQPVTDRRETKFSTVNQMTTEILRDGIDDTNKWVSIH